MGRPRIAVLLLALVAGCGQTLPTLDRSSSPAPTDLVTGSPRPSAVTVPGLGLLLPGDAIAIVGDNVAVHLHRSRAGEAIGTLARGDVVILDDFGPIETDGALWMDGRRIPTPQPGLLPDLPAAAPDPEFPLTGWFVAGDAAGEYVAKVPTRCPSVVDFANVAAMLESERLACLGGQALTFEGFLQCAPCGGDTGTYDPPWLAGEAAGTIVDPNGGGPAGLALYLPSPVAIPPARSLVRVRGHLDDPRAATCQMTLDGNPILREWAVQLCRRHFVVESLEVLPTPTPNPLE